VARGKRRKTEADEMHLSMEVVPDRITARSSRTASRSALGASVVCGPLRRDSQAGTSQEHDRHDSGSMIAGQPERQQQSIIRHSHHGGVKPLGARMFVPRKKRGGRRTRKPK
jgi:hypothetical protein